MDRVQHSVRDTAMRLADMKLRREALRQRQALAAQREARIDRNQQQTMGLRRMWEEREASRLSFPSNKVGLTPPEMSGIGVMDMLAGINEMSAAMPDYDQQELQGYMQWLQGTLGHVASPDAPLTPDLIQQSPALQQVYQTTAQLFVKMKTLQEREGIIGSYSDIGESMAERYPEWVTTEDGQKLMAEVADGLRRASHAGTLDAGTAQAHAQMLEEQASRQARLYHDQQTYRDDVMRRIDEAPRSGTGRIGRAQKEQLDDILKSMSKSADPEQEFIRALRVVDPNMELAARQGAAEAAIQSSAAHMAMQERRRAAEAQQPQPPIVPGGGPGAVGGAADEDPPEEIGPGPGAPPMAADLLGAVAGRYQASGGDPQDIEILVDEDASGNVSSHVRLKSGGYLTAEGTKSLSATENTTLDAHMEAIESEQAPSVTQPAPLPNGQSRANVTVPQGRMAESIIKQNRAGLSAQDRLFLEFLDRNPQVDRSNREDLAKALAKWREIQARRSKVREEEERNRP